MAVTSLNNLELQIKKILVLKNQEKDNSYRFKAFFCIMDTSGVELNLNNLPKQDYYVYFFILDDEQMRDFYKTISGPQRLRFLKNIEDQSLKSVIKNQKGVYKLSVSDLLKNKKFNRDTGNPSRLEFDIVVPRTGRRQQTGLHFVSFVDRTPSREKKLTTGPVVYEKILDFDQNTRTQRVPTKRHVFFIDDPKANTTNGMLYSGPYHYHSEDNPAPSGFVGWMAGHQSGEMGFKLQRREVKNYKVQDHRNLKIEIKKVTQLDPDIPFSPTGTGLEGKTMNQVISKKQSNFSIELINNSILANLNKNKVYVTNSTPATAHIRSLKDTGKDFLDSSYFGCVISIDKFLICQNNTSLGSFINFHRRIGNESLVKLMVDSSRMLNFSIIRRKNTPGSFEKKKKAGQNLDSNNQDYAEKRLVSTTEMSGRLQTVSNARCSIEEIRLVDPLANEANEDILSVSLRDYDLFHNYESGEFTYDVEMTIEDGSEKFINRLYKSFKLAREAMNAYFEEMSTPATYDSSGALSLGSYDYTRGQPEEKSKQFNTLATKTLKTMTLQVQGAHRFLTGESKKSFNLESLLAPPIFDPDTANVISLETKKLELELLNILNSVSPARKRKENPISFKTHSVKSGGSGLKGIVFIKNVTNVIHNLDQLNGLLADCTNMTNGKLPTPTAQQIFSDGDQLNFLNNVPASSSQPKLEMQPSRFLQIKRMRYLIQHEKDVFMGVLPHTQTPGISDNPGLKIVKVEDKSISGVSTVATKKELSSLSKSQKSNTMAKITAMKNLNLLPGIGDQSLDFYTNMTLKGMSGFSIELGDDLSSDFESPIPSRELHSELKKAVPSASDKVVNGLVDSFYKSKDAASLDKTIQEKFKNLISIKETLGNIYSDFSSRIIGDNKLFSNKIKEKNYEEIFLKGSDVQVSGYNLKAPPEDSFEEETFQVELVLPDSPSRKLTISEMIAMMESPANNSTNNFCFVKFVNNKSSKVKLINDGVIIKT